MCKKIKDILFPLNVLGKDKKCVSVDIQSPPYDPVVFNIDWQGEVLDICYTSLFRHGIHSSHESHRLGYDAEEQGTQTFTVNQYALMDKRLWVEKVYFNCTNVTHLVINGTQYI